MSIAVRRKNQIIGKSGRYMNIPSPIEAGTTSTIVANRLILADPRGEISERDLLEFMETQIEPAFWEWWKAKCQETKP